MPRTSCSPVGEGAVELRKNNMCRKKNHPHTGVPFDLSLNGHGGAMTADESDLGGLRRPVGVR